MRESAFTAAHGKFFTMFIYKINWMIMTMKLWMKFLKLEKYAIINLLNLLGEYKVKIVMKHYYV